MDSALGNNTCEEKEKKIELKEKLNCSTGATEASADPLRSSGAETALRSWAPRDRDNLEEAASFSRGQFLGEDLSRESLKGNAASRGMSVLILKEVAGWYTTTSTPLWLTLVTFPVLTLTSLPPGSP